MNDYRSNITGPDLLPAFPNAEPFVIGGHLTHHDKDFDTHCGYLSPDEAAILHTIAKDFPGLWCEIGSHTGWSGAHILTAGNDLVAMEPRFVELPFRERTRENLARVYGPGVGTFYGMSMRSDQYFACNTAEMFDGAFVDGDHDPPMPWNDAQLVLPRLKERAVVVFHDFVGWPVRDGVRYLIGEGFKFRVYNTAQMLGVCWRGDWTPPRHEPDPTRDWPMIRAQHTDFDYSGEYCWHNWIDVTSLGDDERHQLCGLCSARRTEPLEEISLS